MKFLIELSTEIYNSLCLNIEAQYLIPPVEMTMFYVNK